MYIRFYRVSQKNGPEVTQSGPDPQRELGWPKVAQSGPKYRPPIIALKILKVHFFWDTLYKSFAAKGSVTGCNMTPACSFARTPALSE